MSSAVVVDQVHKAYQDITAVNGVSFTVEKGEFFGLLGPNGAGKTTLVEIMEGLRKADSGTVSVLGESPWPRNLRLLPRLGVQTQAAAFFTRLTAAEHIETVAGLYGVSRKRAHELLDRVGLAAKGRTMITELSGGQRQRLAIASALTHDPELLFLDEPTAALDPQGRRDLWELLRQIKAEGKTVIYTTHHLEEAEALCDRVAIINSGEVIAIDEPRALVGSLNEPMRVLVPSGRMTVAEALGITGVDTATQDGGSLVLATRAPGQVLTAVSELIGFEAIGTRTATLEDVYLKLTGTEYKA
jgi:ABC-2 type transport system ATP-binding protein